MLRIEMTELERKKLTDAGRQSIACTHGWRPIETAPKDGTILIGKIPNESPDLNREIKWAFGWCSLYKCEWAGMKMATWLKLNEEHQPTHWMPLPAPPPKESE